MAKHEGELIADIDDGYMKVSNLLAEALCCMPLSGAELRVIWFIMRRTYGWARKNDRTSGKMDVITAREIIKGTQLGKSHVKKCLVSLMKNNVVLSEKMNLNNIMAYGINPSIIQWGMGVEAWDKAKAEMGISKAENTYSNSGDYNTNSVIPITQIVTRYNTNSSIPITQIVTEVVTHSNHLEPVSPCVSRPEGTSTDITDIYTDNDSNDSMSTSKNPKSTSKENRKELDAKIELEIQALRDSFEAADLAQAEDFIELVRSHRKNRVVAKVTVKKTLELLLAIRNEQGITSEAFAYGIEAAIKKDADNTNYVKQAARGYRPQAGSINGSYKPLRMAIANTQWPKETEVI